MVKRLTPAERQLLRELNWAPDKALSYSTLASTGRRAAGVTVRGFRTVMARLEDNNLVSRDGSDVQLTFGGMRALAAVEQVQS